jgi:hypothetical protein
MSGSGTDRPDGEPHRRPAVLPVAALPLLAALAGTVTLTGSDRAGAGPTGTHPSRLPGSA